jgi:hypothetical protein
MRLGVTVRQQIDLGLNSQTDIPPFPMLLLPVPRDRPHSEVASGGTSASCSLPSHSTVSCLPARSSTSGWTVALIIGAEGVAVGRETSRAASHRSRRQPSRDQRHHVCMWHMTT